MPTKKQVKKVAQRVSKEADKMIDAGQARKIEIKGKKGGTFLRVSGTVAFILTVLAPWLAVLVILMAIVGVIKLGMSKKETVKKAPVKKAAPKRKAPVKKAVKKPVKKAAPKRKAVAKKAPAKKIVKKAAPRKRVAKRK